MKLLTNHNLQLYVIVIVLSLITSQLLAQQDRKSISINRLNGSPEINGILDDSSWQNATLITDFIQYVPENGEAPTKSTRALIGYNNNGIYVGAFCYDNPDSIYHELCNRDEVSNTRSDLFGIHINPYDDGNNSYYFVISTYGVQDDLKCMEDDLDTSWDDVWESESSITDSGWIVEVFIPFSAIRFSNDSIQNWGFNLYRKITRIHEWISWSRVNPEHNAWWRYSGRIEGIQDIAPPVRLSFTPYTSMYYNIDTDKEASVFYHAGMDLKYGISNAFTLDMTLIPDFGQVEFDDKVLNLTPYEIQYNERRQFFTEGMELFQKGNLFYSRRIGGIPAGYYNAYQNLDEHEVVKSNPEETKLINASKISGRNKSGLGIGILNAMTSNTYATIEDTINNTKRKFKTQGFTNFNVFVLDQNLKNKSSISFINTSVIRSQYVSNVAGIDWKFEDKKNLYSFWGNGALSYINNAGKKENGFKYLLGLGKVNGRWRYYYTNEIISNTYNQNDLGYLDHNNLINHKIKFANNIKKPFSIFRNMYNEVSLNYSSLYKPMQYTFMDITYTLNTYFKNMYQLFIHAMIAPVSGRDYYEPRVPDRYYNFYKYYHNCFTLGSNYSKRFYYSVHAGFTKSYDYSLDVLSYEYSMTLLYRFNDQIRAEISHEYQKEDNQPGYVTALSDTHEIIFGSRERDTYINDFVFTYILNKRMAFSSRIRHYLTRINYKEYFQLTNNGSLETTDYHNNHDIYYNLFNLDLTYSWEFAPGSELVAVWKNEIINWGDVIKLNYWDNFSNTLKAPQTNTFSLKLLYYIDYQEIKNLTRNNEVIH